MAYSRESQIGIVAGVSIVGVLLLAIMNTTDFTIPLMGFGEISLGFLGTIVEWGSSLLNTISIIGVVVVLMAVVVVAQFVEDENSTLAMVAHAIQAGGVMLAAWAIWTSFDTAMAALRELWFIPIILVMGWMTYVYLRHRQQVATSSTAVDRTQRSIKREVNDISEVTVGVGVLIVTFVLAMVNGIFTAASGLGEPLSLVAGELGYSLVTLVGASQLGLDFPFSGLIPSLDAWQWIVFAAVVGFIVLAWGES